MFGELRGALREQHGQPFGPIDQRHEHRGRHRVGRKMPLQPAAALGIDAEQAPVGEFVARLRAFESPQDPGCADLDLGLAQPAPPPPVQAAARERRRIEQAAQLRLPRSPDISSATSNTGRSFGVRALGDGGRAFVADRRDSTP